MHFAMSLLVAVTAWQGAADDDDDNERDALPLHGRAIALFDDVVFGGRKATFDDAAGAQHGNLARRIATIDLICRLTDNQKRKLDLAGRGDVKRSLDRVAQQRLEFERIDEVEFAKQQAALYQKAFSVRNAFYSEAFRDGSLFDKTLDRCLTAEQATRFGPFRRARWLEQALEVRTRPTGGKEIVAARLKGAPLVDNQLAGFRNLAGLQTLLLESTRITDAGLVHLAALERLEELDLSGTAIEGTGLVHLRELTHLKSLNLRNTHLSASGCDAVGELTHLTSLRLGGVPLGESDFGFVRNLKQLVILSLRDTRISDAEVAELAGLVFLKQLDLDGSQVTDAGLVKLAPLKQLRHLDLRDTRVTDAGLVHLAALENLQYLCLFKTGVTADGVARLKQTLPRLRADR